MNISIIGTESPKALKIMQEIYRKCFDPLAMENSRKVLPTLTYCQDEYETAQASDTLADWLIILSLIGRLADRSIGRLILIESPILLDLRNLYEPAKAKPRGFVYEGIGRAKY
jgi:UDPglucose 6-dehydrogenase